MSRAVVLSGGGPVGVAWQTGLVAGLAAIGVDLSEADLIVGTSAGSAVGAQLALGRDMTAQVERYRGAADRRREDRDGAGSRGDTAGSRGGGRGGGLAGLMQAMAEVAELDAEERLRAIGRFALDADTGPEDEFVETFDYLDGEAWPKRFMCTAVDAETGDFVVWDSDAGVDLQLAVASSCSVPGIYPPVTINGRRYIDGGMRSGTNADLAVGHDQVLLISLMARPPASSNAGATARLRRYRRAAESEHAALRDAGASVATLAPDAVFAEAVGMNLMDGSKVFTALELGLAQAEREAARWRAFWVDGEHIASA